MQGFIHYVKDHKDSEKQAKVSFDSFKKHGYDVELKEGITPDTIHNYPKYDVLAGSRLESFLVNDKNERKHLVKKSCVMNNITFAKRVIDQNKPLLFLEHDSVAVKPIDNLDFDEFCYLAIETWNKPPSTLRHKHSRYDFPYKKGVHDFPENWPVIYHKKTRYLGSKLTPGTIAYALSPKGAKKLVEAVEKYGLEQSDFIINSHVLRLQYVFPALVKHQQVNLNLSHKL